MLIVKGRRECSYRGTLFIIINNKGCTRKGYPLILKRKTGLKPRDPQLGRPMLYQLSYFRNFVNKI